MVLEWLYKDSEVGAHTRGHRIYFGLEPSMEVGPGLPFWLFRGDIDWAPLKGI